MKATPTDAALRQRIREGTVTRADVIRRLAELAFCPANDCVKLVMEEQPNVERLDLTALCEVKRSERGAMEVRLVSRLDALEQLLSLTGEDGGGLDGFLAALKEGEKDV